MGSFLKIKLEKLRLLNEKQKRSIFFFFYGFEIKSYVGYFLNFIFTFGQFHQFSEKELRLIIDSVHSLLVIPNRIGIKMRDKYKKGSKNQRTGG